MADEKKKLGHWVAFEGPDGSGKTTLAKATYEAMCDRGRSVTTIAQPSEGPIGQLLRTILRREVKWKRHITGETWDLPHWQAMSLLFAADRKDQYEREILPKLENIRYVLSDRGPLSNLVYQTAKALDGIDADDLGELSRRYREALGWLQEVEATVGRPSLTFVLAASPELAAERRAARGEKPSVYENSDMQRRISAMYASAAKAQSRFSLEVNPMIELDARRSVPDLVDECIAKMDDVFDL